MKAMVLLGRVLLEHLWCGCVFIYYRRKTDSVNVNALQPWMTWRGPTVRWWWPLPSPLPSPLPPAAWGRQIV